MTDTLAREALRTEIAPPSSSPQPSSYVPRSSFKALYQEATGARAALYEAIVMVESVSNAPALGARKAYDRLANVLDRLKAQAGPTTHDLKTWPASFEEILKGTKRFEVRKTTDRIFAIGDLLLLREYDPAPNQSAAYTDRTITARVTSIVGPSEYGLPPDVVVMGIEVAHTSGCDAFGDVTRGLAL